MDCILHNTPLDGPECGPECKRLTQANAYDDKKATEALINQGVQYAIAEDKAFLAKDPIAEAQAHGGLKATELALALVADVHPAEAATMILLAADSEN